jgi:hypothetical protein
LGYAGKTDEEIQVLLNSPVIVQRIVNDILPSPMARIMRGLADAPNALMAKQDVTEAQKVVLDTKIGG